MSSAYNYNKKGRRARGDGEVYARGRRVYRGTGGRGRPVTGFRRNGPFRNEVDKDSSYRRNQYAKSRNVRKIRKDNNKRENIPINHPNGGKAIGEVNNVDLPNKKYLNPSAYKVMPTLLPQREVTEIIIPLYVPAFEDLGSTVALVAQAMGIDALEVTSWYASDVGACYMFKVCVLYDLWYALFGQYSIVNTAPKWYWDLRAAIMPTRRGKFSYKWQVADYFIGSDGMFPSGVPVTCGDETSVSLAWLTNFSTPNATLTTTIPMITDTQLSESAGEIMTAFFTAMERLSPMCKMVNKDDPSTSEQNPYFRSVAAFCSNMALYSANAPEDRWANFTMEVPLNENERWIACLGLPNGRRAVASEGLLQWTRTGTYTFNEMMSSNYLAYYIQYGHQNSTRHTAVRIKQVSMESIMWAITTTLVQADITKNGKAGTNNINNTAFDASVLYNIPPNYLIMSLAPVMRKWLLYNNSFWNNLNTDAYSLAGSKYYVGGSMTTCPVPRMVGETLADLAPVWFSKKKEDYFVGCVITASGNFGVSPSQDGTGTFSDLTDLVRMLNPGVPVISYVIKPAMAGFTYFDVVDPNKANFMGSLAIGGTSSMIDVYTALQGNIDTAPGSAHVNDSTLMYYTDILVYPEHPSDEDIILKKKKNEEEGKVGDPDWTKLFTAFQTQLVNAYPFTQNQVSYDLTRIRPFTTASAVWYAAVFKTNYGITYEPGEIMDYTQLIVDNAKVYAHPLSTIGGMEQNQMLVDATTQNVGGGFSMIGDLLKGIPIIGPLASGLLGSLDK